ncbi:MAG TPA: DUF4293 domain-containing protein [Bacteroidales bacterium]|nr:DUF4293 domain-containing protein [Bacteroidales bacterium]HOH23449.1 DUF4293 domain-containing protein [Bacteroidales bacterium]HPB58256.1 DUF4293 domain-containing protein [Bacteroidales bacterium]HPZ04049.1 DUF4293 domain-containing protein [Bacteroidales bacterium]HQB75736.1 DUF4293 domain-containing protein [Bacteroidales bacterium]
MIQRIQSIYLLVAGLVTIVLLFIPIGTLTSELGFYTYTPFTVHVINTDLVVAKTYFVAILLSLSSIISFVTIFLYKKRKLQVRLINFNMLVILATLLTMLYIYPKFVFSKISELNNTVLDYNYVILIIALTAMGFYMAKKAILKDEALVRSSERLR